MEVETLSQKTLDQLASGLQLEIDKLTQQGMTKGEIETATAPLRSFMEGVKEEVLFEQEVRRVLDSPGDYLRLGSLDELGKALVIARKIKDVSVGDLAANVGSGCTAEELTRHERNSYWSAHMGFVNKVAESLGLNVRPVVSGA